MDESSSASMPASDAELLNTIRSGDPGAYGALRGHHAAAARRLAGQLVPGKAAAEDVVASAFTRVLADIRRGGGPTDAFRPYLLTAVRQAARDSVSGEHTGLPADEQMPGPGGPFAGPAAAGLEASPLVAAFLSLPERWRAVLWHTEIERAAPSEVAPFLGLPAAGVAELAGHARDGLQQACLQLPAGDPGREYADLADIGAALRSTVAPMVLGDAAAAYLASSADSASSADPVTSAGSASSAGSPAGSPSSADPADSADSGSSAASPAAANAAPSDPAARTAVSWLPGSWLPGKPRGASPRQRALAAGVVLAIVGIAAYALSLSPGTGPVTASGHRTAAGAPRLPTALAPTTVPARRPVRPPAADNRDNTSGNRVSSSRQPAETPVPGASPAPSPPQSQQQPPQSQQPPAQTQKRPAQAQKPPAQTQQPPAQAQKPPAQTQQPPAQTQQPPAQQALAQPFARLPNPALMPRWQAPGAGGWNCTAKASDATCVHAHNGHGTGASRVGDGVPGWRAVTGQTTTRRWPTWQGNPWQMPNWHVSAWHARMWQGPPRNLPPWPGQGAHGHGWPGEG